MSNLTKLLIISMVASSPILAQNPDKGKQVFQESSCSACHHTEDYEKVKGEFPSLKGLYKRKALFNGKPTTDSNVLEIINNGARGMPAYKDMIEDVQKADLITYLKTL